MNFKRDWCNGNMRVFQTLVIGSNPLSRFYTLCLCGGIGIHICLRNIRFGFTSSNLVTGIICENNLFIIL